MKNTNPADIPPILELQRQLERCKTLYIDCLVNNNPVGLSAKEAPNNSYNKIDNCAYIYKNNIAITVKLILENENYKKYNLITNKRFNALIYDAENKTSDFLRGLEY